MISFNARQLKQLPVPETAKRIFEKIEKSRNSYDWGDAISYVLREQDISRQYDVMHILTRQMMMKADIKLLSKAVSDMYNEKFQNCKTLGCFFLLLSYVFQVQRFLPYSYTFRKAFKSIWQKGPTTYYEEAIINIVHNNIHPGLVEQVRVCVNQLPAFLAETNDTLPVHLIYPLVNWILIYPVDSAASLVSLSSFCKILARTACEIDQYTTQFKRDIVISFLLEVIRKFDSNLPGTENLALIFEHMPERGITIIDETRDVHSLPSSAIINCFTKVAQNGISVKTIILFNSLTRSLERQSQFFILKNLYKNVILNIIIRNYKSTFTCQKEIRRLARLYVEGFRGNVPVTKQQLNCFFQNFNILKRKDMEFWLKLARVATQNNPTLQQHYARMLSPVMNVHPSQILSDKDYGKALQNSWQIDAKDLEQRKKYTLHLSRMVGIINKGNRCYIISTLQALYATKCFLKLLQSYQRDYRQFEVTKCKLLQQLYLIMLDLGTQRRSIGVDQVKQNGPVAFRASQAQQDCQEYICALFEQIEKEIEVLSPMKRQSFLADFKRIFQITIRTTIQCQRCHNNILNNENSYIHEIGFQQELTDDWKQSVSHTCQKCKTSNENREMWKKIVKFPEILLVHIKRFGFKNDKEYKQLGPTTIPRKFKNYNLLGFISHIGRAPICGHYVFYCRTENPVVWLEFNDQHVYEFTISSQSQLFQRNFKSASTPYILIYQQTR